MTDRTSKSGEFQGGKCWYELRGDILTLGLTDRGIEEIGQIEDIDFPDDGADFGKGEAILSLEGSRGSLDLLAPAAGLIEEVNEKLGDDTQALQDDPLEEGWLVRLEIQDPTDLTDFEDESSDDDDEDFEDEDEDEYEDEDDEDFDDEDEDEDDEDLDDEDEDGDDEDEDEDDDFEEDEDEEISEDDEEEKPRRGRR